MTHDRAALDIERQVACRQNPRQFIDHVVVHVIVRRPGGLGGVDIKTRAKPEIPGAVRVVGNSVAPGTGVGADNGDSGFGRIALGAGLLYEIVVGAGQPRQPPDQWHEALRRLGRQIDRKRHLATENFGAMFQFELPAAEAGNGTDYFSTHGASCR